MPTKQQFRLDAFDVQDSSHSANSMFRFRARLWLHAEAEADEAAGHPPTDTTQLAHLERQLVVTRDQLLLLLVSSELLMYLLLFAFALALPFAVVFLFLTRDNIDRNAQQSRDGRL